MNRAKRDPLKQRSTSITRVNASQSSELTKRADVDFKFAVDHIPPRRRQILEQGVLQAVRIQRRLLPSPTFGIPGYEIGYHYAPAGPVSGDYCDFIERNNSLLFFFGDISGKGMAASLLMSHLHGTFRSLAATASCLDSMVEAANRIFSKSTHLGDFASLIVGRAKANGSVELINAGHPPLLHLGKAGVRHMEATACPFGMFFNTRFPVHHLNLQPEDTLLLYTDGVTEYCNAAGQEYGLSRLKNAAVNHRAAAPRELIAGCLSDLSVFQWD